MADKKAMPSRLRELPVSADESDVDLILVPCDTTLSAEEWGILSPDSLDRLSRSNSKIRVSAYEHSLPPIASLTWQSILDEGSRLLTALDELSVANWPDHPIIFVSHGIGGLILKQALCIANIQQKPRLLNLIAGIAFLGVPHHVPSRTDFWNRMRSLLICTFQTNLNKQTAARLENDFSLVEDIATRFDDIRLRINILSVFETKETKIKVPYRRSKKDIIVDRVFCTTGALQQQVVGQPLSHVQLPKLGERGVGTQYLDWLCGVVGHSVENIHERTHSYFARHPKRSDTSSSFSSFGTVKQVLSKQVGIEAMSNQVGTNITRHETGDATQGSADLDIVMVPLLQSLRPERREARLPCFMPGPFSRNDLFFGRSDILEQLDNALLPVPDLLVSSERQPSRYAVLLGLAGLGKTETALEFLCTRREHFSAAFWVRADSVSKLEEDFAKIAGLLGLEDPHERRNQVISRDLAKGWLSNPVKVLNDQHDSMGQSAAPWLLVFDNADDPEILMDYTHLFTSGSVLVTSRHPLTTRLPQGIRISLSPFVGEEATRFLQHLTGEPRHLEAAALITEKLGGHPLAIAQMAGVIRGQFLSYTDLLNRYEEAAGHAELHGLVVERGRPTARGTISSVFAIEQLSLNARTVLELLTFLDPDSVPELIMDGLHHGIGGLAQAPMTLRDFHVARSDLLARSLIGRNLDREEISIHRLLQDTVRARLSGSRRHEVCVSVIALVSAAWPAVPLDKKHNLERWQTCERLYPHIIFLQKLYKQTMVQLDFKSELCLAQLLYEAGWWQHERGNSSAIKALLELAYEICKKHGDQQIEDLLSDIHDTLGAIANETNDAKSCLEHNREFLRIRLDISKKTGVPDIRLAIAHNEIGIAWMMTEAYAEATEAFATSIRVYESVPGFTRYSLALPTVNLGLAYWLQGDSVKASSVLEQGLSEREAMFGSMDKESFRTGRFLHALGNVRASQGLVDESEMYHQKALLQYRTTIGNNHHRTADVCHKVAEHCVRRGKHSSALLLVEQALHVWGTDRSVYLPEIARTTFLKAKILYRLGEHHEASVSFNSTAKLWSALVKGSTKEYRELLEDDFFELITFWSK